MLARRAAMAVDRQAPDIHRTGVGPEQFGAHVKSELAKWAKLIKSSNIKPD